MEKQALYNDLLFLITNNAREYERRSRIYTNMVNNLRVAIDTQDIDKIEKMLPVLILAAEPL